MQFNCKVIKVASSHFYSNLPFQGYHPGMGGYGGGGVVFQLCSQSINRLQRFNLLFLALTHFSDFCDKIKYKNKDTKSITGLGKYLLNGYFLRQFCQELYLELNQKSTGELFWKNS